MAWFFKMPFDILLVRGVHTFHTTHPASLVNTTENAVIVILQSTCAADPETIWPTGTGAVLEVLLTVLFNLIAMPSKVLQTLCIPNIVNSIAV